MLANRYLEVRKRSFANGPVVDPHFRPRLRIDADASRRHINAERRDFPGTEGDRTADAESERRVYEIELMGAGSGHDRPVSRRAEHPVSLQHFELNGRSQSDSTGALAARGLCDGFGNRVGNRALGVRRCVDDN